jgi:hypothetical protein
MAPTIIFDAPLTANFQPSLPILIGTEKVVLDFKLIVAVRSVVQIQWYPEFAHDDPSAVNTEWYREMAEEDLGNGDVRMPPSIRRFSTYGADADLPTGTYYFDTQFKRTHKFFRIQILGANSYARVISQFGDVPVSP